MKFASYDIEIAKEVEGEEWEDQRPLGISCAAVKLSDAGTLFWHNKDGGAMTKAQAEAHVKDLQGIVGQGYTLATWNGAAFDFDVLAEESGMVEEVADLCMAHTDLMLIVVAVKGWRLGLDALAHGLRVQGKKHVVTLNDGTEILDMHGGKAPQLWAAGENQAVLDYLGEDVGTLDRLLAKLIANRLTFGWQARSGRWNQFSVPKLFTVEECLKLPRPDVSWMKEPPVMEDMLAWTGRVKAKGVTS